MYFDDFKELLIKQEHDGINTGLYYENDSRVDYFKDSILFKMDSIDYKSVNEYMSKHASLNDYFDVDSIRLPYNNIALQIGKDLLFWITMYDGKECSYLTITEYHKTILDVYTAIKKTIESKFMKDKLAGKQITQEDYDSEVNRFLGLTLIGNHEVSINYIKKKINMCKVGGLEAVTLPCEDPHKMLETAPLQYKRFNYATAIVLFFISLLNCINIEQKINKIDDKLNNARTRKGKIPLVSYYTLEIKSSTKNKNKSIKISTGDHNRVHLCRGHLKRYTEDAPLFGRFVGMWWWAPQARGRKEKGLIVKDYKIA